MFGTQRLSAVVIFINKIQNLVDNNSVIYYNLSMLANEC